MRRTLVASLFLLSVASPSTAQTANNADPISAAVTTCDQLAAHPEDKQRRGPGVVAESMHLDEALMACALAAEATGDTVSNFQLGRILYNLKRKEEALDAYFLASTNNHTLAAFWAATVALDIHRVPHGVNEALSSWYVFAAAEMQRAAKGGYSKAIDELGYIAECSLYGYDDFPKDPTFGFEVVDEATKLGNYKASGLLLEYMMHGGSIHRGGGGNSSDEARQHNQTMENLERAVDQAQRNQGRSY